MNNSILQFFVEIIDNAKEKFRSIGDAAETGNKRVADSYRNVSNVVKESSATESAATRASSDALKQQLADAKAYYAERKKLISEAKKEVEALQDAEIAAEEKVKQAKEWRDSSGTWAFDEKSGKNVIVPTKAGIQGVISAQAQLQGARRDVSSVENIIDTGPAALAEATAKIKNLGMAVKDATNEERNAEQAAKLIARAHTTAANRAETFSARLLNMVFPGTSRITSTARSALDVADSQGDKGGGGEGGGGGDGVGGFLKSKAGLAGIGAAAAAAYGLYKAVKIGVDEFKKYEAGITVLRGVGLAAKDARGAIDEMTAGGNDITAKFGVSAMIDAFAMLHKETDGALATADFVKKIGQAAVATGSDLGDMAKAASKAWGALSTGGDMTDALEQLKGLGVLTGDQVRAFESMKTSGASAGEMYGELEKALDSFAGKSSSTGDSFDELGKRGADAGRVAAEAWGKLFEGTARWIQETGLFWKETVAKAVEMYATGGNGSKPAYTPDDNAPDRAWQADVLAKGDVKSVQEKRDKAQAVRDEAKKSMDEYSTRWMKAQNELLEEAESNPLWLPSAKDLDGGGESAERIKKKYKLYERPEASSHARVLESMDVDIQRYDELLGGTKDRRATLDREKEERAKKRKQKERDDVMEYGTDEEKRAVFAERIAEVQAKMPADKDSVEYEVLSDEIADIVRESTKFEKSVEKAREAVEKAAIEAEAEYKRKNQTKGERLTDIDKEMSEMENDGWLGSEEIPKYLALKQEAKNLNDEKDAFIKGAKADIATAQEGYNNVGKSDAELDEIASKKIEKKLKGKLSAADRLNLMAERDTIALRQMQRSDEAAWEAEKTTTPKGGEENKRAPRKGEKGYISKFKRKQMEKKGINPDTAYDDEEEEEEDGGGEYRGRGSLSLRTRRRLQARNEGNLANFDMPTNGEVGRIGGGAGLDKQEGEGSMSGIASGITTMCGYLKTISENVKGVE